MAERLTSTELYTFFKTQIITPILVGTNYEGMEIIRAYQNAPIPANEYIAIHIYNFNKSKKIVTDLDVTDTRYLIYPTSFILQITASSEEGYDILDIITNKLQLLDIQQVFLANQIVLNTIDQIQETPTLIEDEYDNSWFVNLNMSVSTSVKETISTIETVDYTYTIE